MDREELYLDTLSVLKKLLINNSTEKKEVELKNAALAFIKEHVMHFTLDKRILEEALTQDLIFLKCYNSIDTMKNLRISNFTEDFYIIDIILNYAGNLPVNIYCGSFDAPTLIGTIQLEQLKNLMYVEDN